jgi:hypothetical protein
MRRLLGALAVPFALLVVSSSAAAPPPGATALCRDGTYSFSQHHSGTCSHHGGVATWLDGPATSGSAGTAGTVAVGTSLLVAHRTKSAGCVRGALPDTPCSPGAYYSKETRAVVCSPSFRTSAIRNVPVSEKYAVEREYGMPAQSYSRAIEIDHIVSLDLGGSNNIANLFPERGAGPANYHAKDRLENRLHALVCGGEMTLAAVRVEIAGNWKALYRRVYGTSP